MLKPINVHNKCKYCTTVSDYGDDESYFGDTIGYGCEYFNEGVTILGDTPCDLDDYNKCPNKAKEDKR